MPFRELDNRNDAWASHWKAYGLVGLFGATIAASCSIDGLPSGRNGLIVGMAYSVQIDVGSQEWRAPKLGGLP